MPQTQSVQPAFQKLDNRQREQVRDICRRYRQIPGSLIMVLHDVQDLCGYLPEEALEEVSQGLEIPLAEIFSVATFYSFFSLEPKGKHVLRVCLGTACYVRGSQEVLDELSKQLGVSVGHTTEDGKFTLEAVRCLGACGLAPIVAVGDTVHAKMSASDVTKLLNEYA